MNILKANPSLYDKITNEQTSLRNFISEDNKLKKLTNYSSESQQLTTTNNDNFNIIRKLIELNRVRTINTEQPAQIQNMISEFEEDYDCSEIEDSFIDYKLRYNQKREVVTVYDGRKEDDKAEDDGFVDTEDILSGLNDEVVDEDEQGKVDQAIMESGILNETSEYYNDNKDINECEEETEKAEADQQTTYQDETNSSTITKEDQESESSHSDTNAHSKTSDETLTSDFQEDTLFSRDDTHDQSSNSCSEDGEIEVEVEESQNEPDIIAIKKAEKEEGGEFYYQETQRDEADPAETGQGEPLEQNNESNQDQDTRKVKEPTVDKTIIEEVPTTTTLNETTDLTEPPHTPNCFIERTPSPQPQPQPQPHPQPHLQSNEKLGYSPLLSKQTVTISETKDSDIQYIHSSSPTKTNFKQQIRVTSDKIEESYISFGQLSKDDKNAGDATIPALKTVADIKNTKKFFEISTTLRLSTTSCEYKEEKEEKSNAIPSTPIREDYNVMNIPYYVKRRNLTPVTSNPTGNSKSSNRIVSQLIESYERTPSPCPPPVKCHHITPPSNNRSFSTPTVILRITSPISRSSTPTTTTFNKPIFNKTLTSLEQIPIMEPKQILNHITPIKTTQRLSKVSINTQTNNSKKGSGVNIKEICQMFESQLNSSPLSSPSKPSVEKGNAEGDSEGKLKRKLLRSNVVKNHIIYESLS